MLNNEQVLGLRQSLLAKEIVMVEFTKTNGDIREMTCVLDPETVGVKWEYKDGKSPSENDHDLQVVFDTDVKGFRSFKYSSVTKWAIAH